MQSLEECSKCIISLLNDDKPCWITRFGGSDIPAVNMMIDNKPNFMDINNNLIKIIKKYNGYYNLHNDQNVLHKTIDIYVKSYLNSDFIFFLIGSENNTGIYKILKDNNRLNNTFCYHNFIEQFTPFMNSFKIWGENKKILIISPFKKTIDYQMQNDRLHKILKNYVFPNCNFITYKTPIMYNSDDYSNLNYFNGVVEKTKCSNWIELGNFILDDIKNIDFDIAFLSCGMYAVMLGNLIKETLKKKSIYIGGILNVMFNFYGKRYDTSYFDQFINKEYQIKNLDDFNDLLDNNNNNYKNEGLNAYF